VQPSLASTRHQLQNAVGVAPLLSKEKLLNAAFVWLFKGLVYPQIWEDPEVDLDALEIDSTCHVVTIASGGCNVLSYLVADPAKITAVDLNGAHIALNRLKIAAARCAPLRRRSVRSPERALGGGAARFSSGTVWRRCSSAGWCDGYCRGGSRCSGSAFRRRSMRR